MTEETNIIQLSERLQSGKPDDDTVTLFRRLRSEMELGALEGLSPEDRIAAVGPLIDYAIEATISCKEFEKLIMEQNAELDRRAQIIQKYHADLDAAIERVQAKRRRRETKSKLSIVDGDDAA